MADTGKPEDDGPSLEMPSFSLRRRKKEKKQAPEDVVPGPSPEPMPSPEPEPEPAIAVIPEQPAYDPPTAAVPVVREPAATTDEPRDADDEQTPAEPREPRQLPLSGLPAAAATGVAVGVLAVLLSWLATGTCEAVRGTSSCGGGPGLLILVVVLALLAASGAWLLARFGEPEAGSTSLLAVGITAVLVMVLLLGSLDEPWAAIAVPVTAVVGYCVSWWVTHAVVGEDAPAEPAEAHDVR